MGAPLGVWLAVITVLVELAAAPMGRQRFKMGRLGRTQAGQRLRLISSMAVSLEVKNKTLCSPVSNKTA
jgi:hypothetical protein